MNSFDMFEEIVMKLLRNLLLLTLALGMVTPVFAHEERQVGEFAVEFGWQHEPVYTGQMNGPEFFIFVASADDHAEGEV